MLISDDFIFIHLQKCAGSFVDNLLEKMFTSAKFNGARHDSVRQIGKKNIGKPVFGTIRNPWDWWVSWYAATNGGRKFRLTSNSFEEFWDTVFSTTQPLGELKMEQINELGIGPYTYRFVMRYFRDPDAAFSDWETVEKDPRDFMHPVHLCRVEDLRNELVRFFKFIGIELTNDQSSILMNAPVDNPSTHDFTESYYNNRLRELVREKDRLIVDLYGYSEPWM